MGNNKSTKKGGTKGKAGGSNGADAPQYSAEAVAYAKRAYDAALAHFGRHQGNPFVLSRLAVVYGEQQPGDVHMVVTLPGVMRDRAVTDEEVRGWIRSAELLARTLEHPGCSEAFRTAFVSVFDAGLRSDTGMTYDAPELLRVAIPLFMLDASGTNHVCETIHTLKLLTLLSSDLNSDEVDREVRASLGMQ